MSKFFFLVLGCVFNIFFLLTECQAQEIIKLPFQKKINSDNGLSSNNVNKILQDKFGFIWISTLDGLNRYDGNEFTVYNKSTSSNHLLLGNTINDMIEDTINEILWVTTSYGGINGIDLITGKVVHSLQWAITDSGFQSNWLRCFDICNGKLWIGTDDGLTVYEPLTHKFKVVDPLPFKKYKQLNINCVITDEYKHIWVFLPDYGLVIYSGITNKILKYYTNDQLGIYETKGFLEFLGRFVKLKENACVLGTDHGFNFFVYDSLANIKIQPFTSAFKQMLTSSEIVTCAIDKNNIFWFSTPDHLYRYDFKKKKFEIVMDIGSQDQANWLSSIQYIYFDDQNNLWLGTAKGIAFCWNTEPSFIPYSQAKDASLKIDDTYYVFPDNDSEIYICADHGFYEFNTATGSLKQAASNAVYYYIFKDNNDRIIACSDKGPFVYTSKKMRPIEQEYPELEFIKNEVITSSEKCGDSLLIMGSETGKGVYLWNFKKHSLQNILFSNGEIKNPVVKNIYRDLNNNIWVLFDNALALLDVINKSYKKRILLTDPDLNVPLSILLDMCEVNNDYWLAVYGKGIVQTDKDFNIKKIYSKKEGLLNTSIFKILSYHDSLIFATSNNGLFCMDIKMKNIHQYLKDDGLSANNFNQSCGYVKNEILYAGGKNGFTVIRPSFIKKAITISEFYINAGKIQFQNNSISDTFNLNLQDYTIPNNALQTTISFSALNYANSARVTYEYKIDDHSWISLGAQNFINLIGLAPGTYTLAVRAANEDGTWCTPKTLTLTFLPKWYQTLWFDFLVALAAASLIYGFYRYRLMQLRKQHQIRKEIASDLHDDIGATINSVKIFAHLAETSNNKQKYFDNIKEALSYASTGLRDMIWVLDDSGDTVTDLVNRLKMFAQPVAEASGISIRIEEDPSINNIALNKTEKRNLLLIAKEAINNSIKYSGCKKITVTFFREHNKNTVIIEDNGVGFKEDEIVRGNGLNNMQQRAKQIHYHITLRSEVEKGTKIILVHK